MSDRAQRQREHLTAMRDGKHHTFFDHAMAVAMRAKGWMRLDHGSYVITDAGREEAERALLTAPRRDER